MQQLIDRLWHVVDCVFPWAQPLPRAEAQRQKDLEKHEVEDSSKRASSLPDKEEVLVEYLSACTKSVEAEELRRQSVEARLTTIIGLSSIAGTVAFGGLVAGTAGNLRPHGLAIRWLVMLGALYLILQLCSGILAAVRGLSRRSYLSRSAGDILPDKGEARSVYLRRQIGWSLRFMTDCRAMTNAKVTQMAVAHTAMRNFVLGLVLLSLLCLPFAVSTKSESDLTETLKQNHELRELLRGPQGPPGPSGPKGEPCSSQPLIPKPSKARP